VTEPLWLVHDVPGTGGTSLRMLLAEKLEEGRSLLQLSPRAPDRPRDLCPDDLQRLPAERLEDVRVVIGHQVDRTLIERFPGRRVHEAIVLQDPAERLVSQYNEFHRGYTRQGEPVPSFDEWYERQSVPDFMVKWLARHLLVDTPTPNAVLEALAGIDFVSTCQDMPKTVPTLLRALGIESAQPVVPAPGADDEAALELDGNLRARLEAENPDDHLLYAGIPVIQRLSLARLARLVGAADDGHMQRTAGDVDRLAAASRRSQRRRRLPTRGGRPLTVFDDDTFIVSYPRSGNTWVRFLVANLLKQDDPASSEYVGARVPDTYRIPDGKLVNLPRPRFLKTHESFHPLLPRVIYILRDPREVAPSYLHFLKSRDRIPDSMTLDSFLPRFVKGRLGFGSWRDHVVEWITVRAGDPDFLLVRYERLVQDPEGELERIAAFAGIPADEGAIRRAVERSSLESMRAQEEDRRRRGGTIEEGLRLGIACIGADAKEVRSDTGMKLLEDRWRPTMTELGYL
jgi:Sulfotransferase domain